MSVITIEPGGLVIQDPSDKRIYVFDWDADNLAAGVSIASSTMTITALRPSDDTALLKDNVGLIGTRKTTLRLYGGTLGALYEVANKIVTDESPAQTKERSFKLLVQEQ